MEPVDNNQFEIKPSLKNKRKLSNTFTNVYLNPALDLLVNDDPMCNNKMEIVPNKKRKRTRSCDIAAFENSALDLGISKKAVNEFLIRELENVKKNLRNFESNHQVGTNHEVINAEDSEPIYANLNSSDPCLALSQNSLQSSLSLHMNNALEIPIDNMTDVEMDSGISVMEQKSLNPSTMFDNEISAIEHINITAESNKNNVSNVTNQMFLNNPSNLSLSFIDRLALDSSNVSNQSLYLDDDLNESNIMEIKTITIITKKKRKPEKRNTNPFLNHSFDDTAVSAIQDNPFLSLNQDISKSIEFDYNNPPIEQTIHNQPANALLPRRLFAGDTNSTVSTVDESMSTVNRNEYENIDGYRSESPIYENVGDDTPETYNKQSKILGHDVSQFNATDILNLNKISQNTDESNDSKKAFKHNLLRVGNRLSKRVLKKIKKTFKSEKHGNDVTLNPYEVPRKQTKQKPKANEAGIENPALNLDNTGEIELEELDYDEEHQYETVKTIRNTQLNTNVTPLRERVNEPLDYSNTRVNTPGKKQVRFDSTLNREKVITGDSFDCDVQSPGFDVKIDKYQDELENCINERKFIQQNMQVN